MIEYNTIVGGENYEIRFKTDSQADYKEIEKHIRYLIDKRVDERERAELELLKAVPQERKNIPKVKISELNEKFGGGVIDCISEPQNRITEIRAEIRKRLTEAMNHCNI